MVSVKPLPDIDSNEGETDADVYEVEDILADRVNENGINEYYVKWAGYDWYDNTWEPEQNLFGAEKVLKKWKKRKKLIAKGLLEPFDAEDNEAKKMKREKEILRQQRQKRKSELTQLSQKVKEKFKKMRKKPARRIVTIANDEEEEDDQAMDEDAFERKSMQGELKERNLTDKTSTLSTSFGETSPDVNPFYLSEWPTVTDSILLSKSLSSDAIPLKNGEIKSTMLMPSDSDNSVPGIQNSNNLENTGAFVENANSPQSNTPLSTFRHSSPLSLSPTITSDNDVANSLFFSNSTPLPSSLKIKKEAPKLETHTILVSDNSGSLTKQDILSYFAFIKGNIEVFFLKSPKKDKVCNMAYIQFDSIEQAKLAYDKGHPSWHVTLVKGKISTDMEECKVSKSILKTTPSKKANARSVSFTQTTTDTLSESEKFASNVDLDENFDFNVNVTNEDAKQLKKSVIGSSWTTVNNDWNSVSKSDQTFENDGASKIVVPAGNITLNSDNSLHHSISESEDLSSASTLSDYFRFVLRVGKSLYYAGELSFDISKLKAETEHQQLLRSLVSCKQVDVLRFVTSQYLEVFGTCLTKVLSGSLGIRSDVDMTHFKNILNRGNGAGIVLGSNYTLLLFTEDNNVLMNLYDCQGQSNSPFWMVIFEPLESILVEWSAKNLRPKKPYHKSQSYLSYLLQLGHIDLHKIGAFQATQILIVSKQPSPEAEELEDTFREAAIPTFRGLEIPESLFLSQNVFVFLNASLEDDFDQLQFLTLAKRKSCKFFLFGLSLPLKSPNDSHVGTDSKKNNEPLDKLTFSQYLRPMFPKGGVVSVTLSALIKTPRLLELISPFLEIKKDSWILILPPSIVDMVKSYFVTNNPDKSLLEIQNLLNTLQRYLTNPALKNVTLYQDWDIVIDDSADVSLASTLQLYQKKNYDKYRRFVLIHELKNELTPVNGLDIVDYDEFKETFMRAIGLK
ncbi:Chromodomain protein Chp1 [Schizosaccharomyces pombe]